MRDLVIVNHSGFYAPLREGLAARGISFADEKWEPEPLLLNRTLACFVWFYDCLRYPLKTWRLKRRLADHGVPLVAWNQDAPHYLNRKRWRLDLLDRFRLLDVYATHALVDAHRRFADLVLYLPNAADPSRYGIGGDPREALRSLRDPATYLWDVSFFGGMDGMRYKEDRARADFFGKLSGRLTDMGIRSSFLEAAGMSIDEQVALIQTSRININFGARCEYLVPVASGLPERCFGIPACGGFLLCDKRTHAADHFKPGYDWAEFNGLDDCVAQIEYWLAHFDEARDLAERCYHRVVSENTYLHRAAKLHDTLLAWHAGKRGLIK